MRTAIVTACAAVLFVAYGLYAERSSEQFFSEALRLTNAKGTVVLGGTSYRIENEAVYDGNTPVSGIRADAARRLAYAKTVAENSPLLALPGEDPGELLSAAETLAEAQTELADGQTKPESKDAVISGLYPTDLMRALAEVERTRVLFVQSGSDSDEHSYEAAQRSAVGAYRSDSSALKNAFVRTVPDGPMTYGTADALLSKTTMLSALDILQAGTATLEKKLFDRALCFSGSVDRCDANDLREPELPTLAPVSLSAKALSVAKDVRSILSSALGDAGIASGPAVALSDSSCMTGIPGAPIFALQTTRKGTSPILVGDLRLAQTDANVKYIVGYLAKQGVHYLWYQPLSHYRCLKFGSDISGILVTYSVSELTQTSPVSRFASSAKTANELRDLEKKLAPSNAVIEEADALAYISLAETVDTLPQDIAGTLHTLHLQFAYRSKGFSDLTSAIAQSEESDVRLAGKGVSIDLSAPRLFLTESAVVPLFLADNPSVMTLSAPLFPSSENLLRTQNPFIFYSTSPHTALFRETIVRDIRSFTDMFKATTP